MIFYNSKGTWPFISVELHDNGCATFPDNIQHTPLDDLESSIWVLLWELYYHGREHEGLTKGQLNRDMRMRHHDVIKMLVGKRVIAINPEIAFPECLPINQFIGS